MIPARVIQEDSVSCKHASDVMILLDCACSNKEDSTSCKEDTASCARAYDVMIRGARAIKEDNALLWERGTLRNDTHSYCAQDDSLISPSTPEDQLDRALASRISQRGGGGL